MSDTAVLTLLVAAVMAIGLIGTLLPLVPGLALVWCAALVYGLFEGFGTIGIVAMVVITALLVGSIVLGFVLPQRMASASGASMWAQVAALVGAIVGFFVIPVVGAIIGALLGILAAEWYRTSNFSAAVTSTKAMVVGMGWSALANFGIGIVMITTWVVWVVVG